MTALAMPYETLWAEHEPAARRLALSLVPAHAAGDVVAEAFTRVLSAAERGGGPRGEFRPYFLAAVRNTAYSWLTRSRRAVPVADPDPGPVDGPEHAVLGREDGRLAARAFATLPERWRWVLWSTAVEEKTPAELGEVTGMAANSVAQLASRAREGLRQAYLNEHVGSQLPPACRAVAPYMGASVRGKAGHRHQAELGAHLRSCERCAQAYAGLGQLNSHLGELLVPGAAAIPLALSRLIPRPGLRWLHLVPAAAVAAVAVGGAVTVTTVVTAPPSHAAVRQDAGTPVPAPAVPPAYVPRHARPQPLRPGGAPPLPAAQAASAASPSGPAGSGTAAGVPSGTAPGAVQPSSGQAAPGAAAQGIPAPVAGTAGQAAGQAAGAAVTGAGQAAGQVVSSAGQAAGQVVSSAGQVVASTVTQAGQVAAGAVPVPAVSAAASQVTSSAGSTVSQVSQAAGQVTSSAGSTAGQVTSSAAGAVGSAAGGL